MREGLIPEAKVKKEYNAKGYRKWLWKVPHNIWEGAPFLSGPEVCDASSSKGR